MYRYISTYLHLHLHRHQHLQLYTYTYTCTYTCTYTYTYTYTYTHTHTNTAASSQTYLWSYIYMHISHAKPHRQPTPNTARPAPGSPFSATHARPGFCTATPAPLPPWPLAFPGGPGLGLCIFLVPRAQLVSIRILAWPKWRVSDPGIYFLDLKFALDCEFGVYLAWFLLSGAEFEIPSRFRPIWAIKPKIGGVGGGGAKKNYVFGISV